MKMNKMTTHGVRRSALGLAALTLLLLGGCAATGELARPTEPRLPEQWQHGTQAEARPQAWAGMLDPELQAFQREALARNRDLAMAALRFKDAERQLAQQGLRLQPSASLSSSANRPLESGGSSRSVDVGGVQVPVETRVGWNHSYSASLSASYEPDLWGRLAARDRGLVAQRDQVQADIAAARVVIEARAAEIYWTLGAQARLRPLAQAQLEAAEELLRIVKLRVREGKLLPVEVDRAAQSVLSAQHRLADLEAEVQLQAQQRALLLDQLETGADAHPPGRLPDAAPPAWVLGSPAQVLGARPDVQKARLQVDAALASLAVAEASRYPSLSFTGSIATGGSQARDWLSQPVLSLSSSLLVPLIDWRRLNYEREGARTGLEQAALSLRDTVHKALVDAEGQWTQREKLQRQTDAQARRVAEARENERLAALRLEVGAIGRNDWLQARVALLEAQQSLLQLQLQGWLNQAALYRALGGVSAG